MSKWKINFHWTRDRSMKYLLSILVLFSGLTFSEITETHLICDKKFDPPHNPVNRILIRMADSLRDKEKGKGQLELGLYVSNTLSYFERWTPYSQSSTKIFIESGAISLENIKIDRQSLMMSFTYTDSQSRRFGKQKYCKKVDKTSFNKAEQKLKAFAKQQRDNRKI